ncbi:MAG: hypothetical protein FJ146_11445 [Deltaproteobacteria bacterium]|nr:hypothetical protein [Deltaproteobacteria bacterium]
MSLVKNILFTIAATSCALGLVGCSAEDAPKPPKPKSATFSSGSGKGISGGTVSGADAKGNPAEAIGGEGSLTDVSSAVDNSADEAAFMQIMKDCGFPEGKMPEPTKVLFQKTMRSLPVTIRGSKAVPASALPGGAGPLGGFIAARIPPAVYTAVVRSTATVSATMAGTKQSVRTGLESFNVSIPNFPFQPPADAGRADAQKEVEANNSDATAVGPSEELRGELIGQQGPWRGIICTVTPTQTLTVSKPGANKTVSFNPPLPGGIWMKSSPKRFQEEIGEGKSFTVVATVTASQDPLMATGSKVGGTVTVKPVSGQLGELSVNADIAYEIRTNFGDKTVALGLTPVQTFYVTSNTQDLRAIVLETGVQQIPRLVMAPAQ